MGVFHTWDSELPYVARPSGRHSRHVDLIRPLWNAPDVTPTGGGADWLPRLRHA